MTLNITVAAPWFVCQSSDLRLTNPDDGTPVDDASPKQVHAGSVSNGWQALIGYTGLSRLDGLPVHDWVTRLAARGAGGSVEDLVEVIRAAATRALQPAPPNPRQSFTVAAAFGDRARAFLISNFQEVSERDHTPPKNALYTRQLKGNGPHVVVIGATQCVTSDERILLHRLARDREAPQEICEQLATINARVARSNKTVSKACVAGHLLPDGSGATRQFGDVKGEFVPRVVMQGVDVTRLFMEQIAQTGSPAAPPNTARFVVPDTLASCERFSLAKGWTLVEDMISPRRGHSSTRLLDGRVLIAGGDDGSQRLAVTEIFDPSSGRWTAAMQMLDARAGHGAALLPVGKVLVVGGHGTDPAACEVYDPVADCWEPTGRLSIGRANHAIVPFPNGETLAIGGTDPNGRALSSVELYKPATGIWEPQMDLCKPRYQLAAIALSTGSVLVVGGHTGASITRTCERLPALGGAWAPADSLAWPRHLHQVTLLRNDDVLVLGGGKPGACEVYADASGTWSPAGSMLVDQYLYFSLTMMADGGAFVCGGDRVGNAGSVAETELFDPSTRAWKPGGPMTVPRAWHAATLLADGDLLVTGGIGPGPAHRVLRRSSEPVQLLQSAMKVPRAGS